MCVFHSLNFYGNLFVFIFQCTVSITLWLFIELVHYEPIMTQNSPTAGDKLVSIFCYVLPNELTIIPLELYCRENDILYLEKVCQTIQNTPGLTSVMILAR